MRMIQLHKQKEGIRINFSPIHQTIAKSLEVETHPLLLWAGYYTFFPQMFVHAYLMGDHECFHGELEEEGCTFGVANLMMAI